MKTKFAAKLLSAAVVALSAISSAQSYAASCPSDAICRDDVVPGKYSRKGPYRVADYRMPLFSTPGGATVYYPTDAEPPFSSVVFTPPFLGSQFMYDDWGPFFASYGIVTVITDSVTIFDTVDLRASQQQSVLKEMKDENDRFDSPLRGKLDTSRQGAMGWSMGGGASWITSAEYRGLRSTMSLAGHNLSAVNWNSKGFSAKTPTMLFNGVLDLTYLGGLGQSDGVYAAIPRDLPKAYYNVASTGHFAWGGPTAANRYVGELALAFHKAYLDGDLRWAQYIERPPRDVATYRESNIPNY